MDRTTTVAIMAAILAAPRKGDYDPRTMAESAVRLHDFVTAITRPLDGAVVIGSDDLSEPTPLTFPATWLDVAISRGAKRDQDGNFNGAELERVGVQLIAGCAGCGATVAAYGAYQINPKNDYAYCHECAENATGVTI